MTQYHSTATGPGCYILLQPLPGADEVHAVVFAKDHSEALQKFQNLGHSVDNLEVARASHVVDVPSL